MDSIERRPADDSRPGQKVGAESPDVVLLNQVNPVYVLGPGIKERLDQTDAFVVCFSNFMDETA
ncbi:MAG: hypothetical protein ACQESL_05080, partial [Bacteroidota bacterium]